MGLRSLLGILEIAIAQEHLLARLEGWHPEVGAVGTAESVTQVALWKNNSHIERLRAKGKGHLRTPTRLLFYEKSVSMGSSHSCNRQLGG